MTSLTGGVVMGGRFSRNKGRRGEQQLVLHLIKLGFKAERILRQYQAAGQPDVVAEKDGNKITFELKCRRKSFKSIYGLYYRERQPNSTLCFVFNSSSTPVAMSTDLEALMNETLHFKDLSKFPPADSKDLKYYVRIERLKELKQSADYLVIKDNNHPRLYLRFW